MKALVYIEGNVIELKLAGNAKTKETIASELSQILSQASSMYIELKEGGFIIIPEKALAHTFFTIED